MILDYKYRPKKRIFEITHIQSNGSKCLEAIDCRKGIPTYTYDGNGEYTNWDGKKCSLTYTNAETPSWADLLGLIHTKMDDDKTFAQHLLARTNPQLYTFDIETMIKPDVFPDPAKADFPITNISIVNDKLIAVVLGTRRLTEEQQESINKRYLELLSNIPFYSELDKSKLLPSFKYIYFPTEREMLEFFLKQIVSKAPVLAGWNSLLFDWQYIQNRCKRHYPEINFASCSMSYSLSLKNVTDQKGQKVKLLLPDHTLVWDMMDIICTHDMAVMPIKESKGLDYIASNSIGQGKIQYDGNLDDLYNNDYETYVYYNTIDSVLVQLLDKRFKTTNILYGQSLICKNRISTSLSKIAITESMFFNYFWDNNIHVVPNENRGFVDRGELAGAYVREPVPGKHNFVCCNDFASLYPSVIITCNLSIENYMGTLGDPFTQKEIDAYKKTPGYFVSVNNDVYKNDKDYAFKNIQAGLKRLRSQSKYLGKNLDATVGSDIEHIINNRTNELSNKPYPEAIQKELSDVFNITVVCPKDLISIPNPKEFNHILREHIDHLSNQDLSTKLIMNSMYGGSSHISFEWFNINLANDITGEGRNLIHIMEQNIPSYIQTHWQSMTDIHKQIGISVRQDGIIYGHQSNTIIKPVDRDKDLSKIEECNTKDTSILCQPIAGDTDSIYFCYEGLLNTIVDIDKKTITQKAKILADFNNIFLNSFNKKLMEDYYKTRNIDRDMVHEFELETISYAEIRLNVKKRYSQVLIWKDGKFFDEDHMKSKTKGLEMVKASYPTMARNILTTLVKTMLLDTSPDLREVLNKKMQEYKKEWSTAALDLICPSIKVSNYTKYIESDSDPMGIKVKKGCPFTVRGLAYYNWLRIKALSKHISNPGDPIYGGKLRYYVVKMNTSRYGIPSTKDPGDVIFTFDPDKYPSWAETLAPIDRTSMFKRCVLDPFNRILSAIGMQKLTLTGWTQASLWDLLSQPA